MPILKYDSFKEKNMNMHCCDIETTLMNASRADCAIAYHLNFKNYHVSKRRIQSVIILDRDPNPMNLVLRIDVSNHIQKILHWNWMTSFPISDDLEILATIKVSVREDFST